MHSCSPIASPIDNNTFTTASSSIEPGYDEANIDTVTLNAVDIFKPVGISPIPTDIQLVLYEDNPIGDEFQTSD